MKQSNIFLSLVFSELNNLFLKINSFENLEVDFACFWVNV